MADIFISYSSKDRIRALQLSALLGSAGFSVWTDQSGINAAANWPAQIVQAINTCRAFIVLLSANSVESHNVIKEVSLASDKQKKILPLELEPVRLPAELEYQLAGIQRAPVTNTGTIIRALDAMGLQAQQTPTIRIAAGTDARKSLMILPFDDLSPAADSQWFADGIVSEMITSLSNVKSLRVTDAQTTKEYKSYKGQLTVYAREMNIRYFVGGDVRKSGDQIKISSRLLDIETGDTLWQNTLKGTMENIFDIQEAVAKNVVEGLQIILTREEEKELKRKPTDNAEAYELYLKGSEYFGRQTRTDFERALGLFEEAIRIEPGFGLAHFEIANVCLAYYRGYSRNRQWLDKAGIHIGKAESAIGQTPGINWIRSLLKLGLGQYEEAVQIGQGLVELDPEFAPAYGALGLAYTALGRLEAAADAWERQVQLRENDRSSIFHSLIALNTLGDAPRLTAAALRAIPVYERYLRLNPDDPKAMVDYANILKMAGQPDRAVTEARKIEGLKGLDGYSFYNLACLYLGAGENQSGLRLLRKSVELGARNIEVFRNDPDLNPLRGTPEFDALIRELDQRIESDKNDV